MNAEERVLSRLTPEDLSIIKIDGNYWLGNLDEERGIITDGYNFGSASEITDKIETWFLAWNIETLTQLKLSKMASYTVRKLFLQEIEEFERVKAKLLRVKKYAVNYWENQVYSKHIS